jgi:eukaryotic-like serine/threonine-protein kinase
MSYNQWVLPAKIGGSVASNLWQRISQLYHDALARDISERSAFLDVACAGDAELRQEVDSLLERVAKTDSDFGSFVPEIMLGLSSKSRPLSSLSPDALRGLLSAMSLREYDAGQHLIRQGDAGGYLLLILSGTASAFLHHRSGEQTTLSEFGPGDVIGEMSLVTDEPRTADVISRTPVRSLLLSTADFHRLADQHPEVRVLLTNVMADRLGKATYDGLSGKEIHGYQIVRCIGRGGMGIVYEATRLATGETVAMKMMNHRLVYQPGAVQRFRQEAESLKSLQHDSIARLYECFGAYKTQFLVMEFCEGSTLNKLIAARRPLNENVVRKIVGQLAIVLHYVHGQGLIHRDLKPSNIMLTRSGLIKLLDFGLVKLDTVIHRPGSSTDSTVSHSVSFVGTPQYMAPEQFACEAADYRSDFYGLACVAYEALSGRPLIGASDLFRTIQEKLQFVLPPPGGIGRGVTIEMHEFLARGLDHRPEKRDIDLGRLATWAGPVDLGALTGES